MKALIALLILGSIGTSASAAGTDMHLLRPVFPSGQQHSTLSQSQISGTALMVVLASTLHRWR